MRLHYLYLLQFFLLFIIAFTLSTKLLSASRNGEHPSSFIDAYERIGKGLLINTQSLINHPLYPYLAYKKIIRNKAKTSDQSIKHFIQTYPNSLMAEQLWINWLERLAKRKEWAKIIQLYDTRINKVGADCLYYEAKIALKKDHKKTIKKALNIWLTGNYLSNACSGLFNQLRKTNHLDKNLVWDRIDLAMTNGKTKLVKTLANQLAPDEKKLARLLAYSHRHPKKALRSKSLGRGRYSRRVILHSIQRIARKNVKKAKKRWQKIEKKYAFNQANKAKINAYFAYQSALNHDKSALRSFIRIPKQYRTDHSHAWMARSAIRQSNWKKTRQAINAMSEKEKQRDIWRYWLAKTYLKSGNKAKAQALLHTLKKDASFYGFLAADLLKTPYPALNNKKDRSVCIQHIKTFPSIQRSLAWFKLGKESNAQKEWYWTLKHLNKEGQLTMAALALAMDQPLLAVSTVSYTKDWNQVQLRFPMLYKTLISKMSSKNNVSPAWVYGIMRRESVFNKTAKSHAKAMGLMQILPSTARYVAKKLGFKISKEDLFTPDINVRLGSAYLSQLLDRQKGNYVKATASYNAGPGNVSRWKPSTTLDADQWVETIPFTETRKYVRAVMSYTTIYDYKLHGKKGLRLSERLSPVPAK